MSMCGEGEREELYEAMREFLQNHSVYELIDILRIAVQVHEGKF